MIRRPRKSTLFPYTTLFRSVNTWQFGACRFLGAMGLGGEWGLGVALVMETWPDSKRPLLAGVLGAAANVGFLLSSIIGLVLGGLGWRVMLLIGLAPSLLALMIRFWVKEPEAWKHSKERGEKSDAAQLWKPPLRRRTILASIVSSVVIVGTWGVFQWIPTWVNTLVGGDAVEQRATPQMYMAFGQIIGALLGGLVADWFGRRLAYSIYCVTSFITAVALYGLITSYGTGLLLMAAFSGIFATAFFGWLPLYLPELFPTRIRATGEGITYNFGRILAAIGVVAGTGQLVKVFGGSFAKAGALMAAVYLIGLAVIWFMPETKGQKLPD